MSVARPQINLDKTTIITKVVKNAVQLVEGVGVMLTSNEADLCIANSKVFGVAQSSVLGDGSKTVQIALLDGGIVKVKCSGTATAGEYAICGTDGFENQTIGGGTTVKYIAGQFTQDGVDGDFVGLRVGGFAAGCA